MTLGDRIVVMNIGHVQQIDTPMHLYDHPANRFVAGFIGSPAMNFVTGTIDQAEFVASHGAFTLRIPPSLASRLEGISGKAVTMGIRPEDVSVAPISGPALFAGESTIVDPPALAPARLDIVEALGNEIFVYATVGPFGITARISPQPLPAPGEPVTLAFDLAKAHLFDQETGNRVGKG
jgi:multiple sugar transport system ATP-binding protein